MTLAQESHLTVGEFVARLAERCPLEWAEEWDRAGLLAGDAAAPLHSVLVTLDADRGAVQRAADGGHGLLLTHHPALLSGGLPLTPGGEYGVVFHAVRAGVALVAMHTNLDRSSAGGNALATALGLEGCVPLETAARPGADQAPLVPGSTFGAATGLGRLCTLDSPVTLSAIAMKCSKVLGADIRTWGERTREVTRVALANGSGGSLIDAALRMHADVLITGEVRYHDARAALDVGLAIVETGHDASEWPLVRVLAHAAREAVAGTDVHIAEERPILSWWTTERH